jgi:hypothetical protein
VPHGRCHPASSKLRPKLQSPNKATKTQTKYGSLASAHTSPMQAGRDIHLGQNSLVHLGKSAGKASRLKLRYSRAILDLSNWIRSDLTLLMGVVSQPRAHQVLMPNRAQVCLRRGTCLTGSLTGWVSLRE